MSMGKQIKTLFKSENDISTSRPLELLHMDLFGPPRTCSLSEKIYTLLLWIAYLRGSKLLLLKMKP